MITIPENLKGKELHKFLLDNKSALIAQKKSCVKYTDSVSFMPDYFAVKGASVTKADINQLLDVDTIRVKVVMNAANWCDSHGDVLLPNCWNKTIKERKGLIPHIHDHIHESTADVGEVINILSQNVSLSELGINKSGSTQCLVFETDIKKSYNEKIFYKYRDKRVKQHSIGLMYVGLDLAINDEDSMKEKEFWDKHIENVINKEQVEEQGYFWVVPEIKLLEGSCVLFGSNILTPTLDVKTDTVSEPHVSTHEQPFDIMTAIKNLKLP